MRHLDQKRILFLRALSRAIRECREAAGLSLTQLGTRAGLSQQSVSYVEKEMRYPNVETLLRISDAFGMSLSELIKRAEHLAPAMSGEAPAKKPLPPKAAAGPKQKKG